MKKKIILVVIVVFAVAVSGVFVLTKCLKTNSNHEQVNVAEEKDEEFNLQEEEQINLKHQQKFLKLPKKQKLNLAIYRLQVANYKKKNKRIKQPKVIKIMVQVIKDNRTKSQQLFMILLLTEKKSFLLKVRL